MFLERQISVLNWFQKDLDTEDTECLLKIQLCHHRKYKQLFKILIIFHNITVFYCVLKKKTAAFLLYFFGPCVISWAGGNTSLCFVEFCKKWGRSSFLAKMDQLQTTGYTIQKNTLSHTHTHKFLP